VQRIPPKVCAINSIGSADPSLRLEIMQTGKTFHETRREIDDPATSAAALVATVAGPAIARPLMKLPTDRMQSLLLW